MTVSASQLTAFANVNTFTYSFTPGQVSWAFILDNSVIGAAQRRRHDHRHLSRHRHGQLWRGIHTGCHDCFHGGERRGYQCGGISRSITEDLSTAGEVDGDEWRVQTNSGWLDGGEHVLLIPDDGRKAIPARPVTTQNNTRPTTSQTLATDAGVHYTVSFWAVGILGSGNSNRLVATWNGQAITTLNNVNNLDYSNFQHYTADVVGQDGISVLQFALNSGQYWILDDVTVTTAATPGVERTTGVVGFTDGNLNDSHSVSYVPVGTGYVGTFAPQVMTDGAVNGLGGVKWTFTANDSDLQFLAQGQVVQQFYDITITDNGSPAKSVTQRVEVDLVGVNDAPVAVADTGTTAEDTRLVVNAANGVLSNDTDVDHDVLTVVAGDFTTAQGGTIHFNVDGSYTYTPKANFFGADSVNYTVKDAFNATSTGTLSLTVSSADDAPVVTVSNFAIVSTSATGALGNNESYHATFSSDGTKVAFATASSNLVAGDTGGIQDIFIKDLITGAITRVSTTSAGVQANNDSDHPVFSPDGTKIAFWSAASNLVAGDTGNFYDIFVKDLVTGAVTRVSTTSTGTQGNNDSQYPVFSPDGTKILFESAATNLVTGDTNARHDLFMKDLVTGAVTRVSTATGARNRPAATATTACSPRMAPRWPSSAPRPTWSPATPMASPTSS